MTTTAELADMILQAQGHGDLWTWAMNRRNGKVRPPSYDLLAEELGQISEGRVAVTGQALCQWLKAIERKRAEVQA